MDVAVASTRRTRRASSGSSFANACCGDDAAPDTRRQSITVCRLKRRLFKRSVSGCRNMCAIEWSVGRRRKMEYGRSSIGDANSCGSQFVGMSGSAGNGYRPVSPRCRSSGPAVTDSAPPSNVKMGVSLEVVVDGDDANSASSSLTTPDAVSCWCPRRAGSARSACALTASGSKSRFLSSDWTSNTHVCVRRTSAALAHRCIASSVNSSGTSLVKSSCAVAVFSHCARRKTLTASSRGDRRHESSVTLWRCSTSTATSFGEGRSTRSFTNNRSSIMSSENTRIWARGSSTASSPPAYSARS
eukprot:PhM_4_TR17032/c0_g1_i1/m.94627